MSTAATSQSRLPVLRWLRTGRGVLILASALLIWGIGQSGWFRGRETFRRWEGQAHDMRFRLRGTLPNNPDVAIVGIKSSSLDQQNYADHIGESDALRMMRENPWPWPRPVLARAVERLFQAGARVVAVDVVFSSEREGDDEFAAVLEKYRGRIVLASVLQVREGDHQGGAKANEFVFFQPNSRFTAAAGVENVGFAKYSKDVDDVMRRFDYRTSELREYGMDDDSGNLVAFAPLAVARFSGAEAPRGYAEAINFSGPPLTYPSVPIENLFIESTWKNDPRTAGGAAFKDKLVFIGPYAEVLHDVHTTPFGGATPGVEIHAQLAASLLEHRTLHDVSRSANTTVALVSALVGALTVLLIRNALLQSAVILLLGGGFLAGVQGMFEFKATIMPVVPALSGLFATGAFGVVYLFFLEQWEKAHTRRVLNRFVSKRIAEVILKNAEEFEHGRGGEKRAVAILFSDIRGFTTWSEGAKPEHLVGQLNEYFERMVNHIEESEGNAQKFIGDAILAAWGDTHSNGPAEDARRAVATALKMRPTLRELNAQWHARDDRREINIGIGINHGEVVVGEVGHPERREFTVLGDGVNFAARLESATKQFHTDCLVGESVEALTRERFVFRHVDFIRVKGKTHPVNVFMPLSEKSTPPPGWLADYHAAREQYTQRQFTEAAKLFRKVDGQIGGGDFLCGMYLERCEQFAQNPPPADWDGSYTLTEK